MMKKNKFLVWVMILCLSLTLLPIVVHAEESEENIMTNGAIESAGVIDSLYGNVGLWYSNTGGLDAEFVTNPVYGDSSTGAMLHHGEKDVYYRFFMDYQKVIDKNYHLEGYLYTQADGVSIEVSLNLMQGIPPYGSRLYPAKSFTLTKDAWTKIDLTFCFDSAASKLIIGNADTEENGETDDITVELAEDYNIMNVAFTQKQENKADVVYDDFSCVYGKELVDYTGRNYQGEYDNISDFNALSGNLVSDADMTKDRDYPAVGKWGSWGQSVDYGKTEDEALTGTTSYYFEGPTGQDIRYGFSTEILNGKEHSFSVYCKQIESNEILPVRLQLTVSGYRSDGSSYQFAMIPLDAIDLDSSAWRELRGTASVVYDATTKTVTYSANGGEEKVVEDMATLLSVDLQIIVDKQVRMYLDSATCFEEHTSKIKFLDNEENPISDLTLDVKDVFGNSSDIEYSYNAETGYYEFEKSYLPLTVSVNIGEKTVEKTLKAGTDDVVVGSAYIPKVTLKDDSGKVISGANVKLIATNGTEILLAESAEAGVYIFEDGVDESSYQVIAFKQGYTFTEQTITRAESEIEMIGVETKPVTFSVAVSLVDSKYQPIKGAKVELLENDEVIYTLEETEDGVYSLDGIEGFQFEVRVTLDGWTFESATLDANNRNITVSGQKGAGKSGCGSSVTGSALIIACGIIAGSSFLLKRKGNRV